MPLPITLNFDLWKSTAPIEKFLKKIIHRTNLDFKYLAIFVMHLLSVVSCVLFFLNDDCSLSGSLISSTGPDGLSSQLVTQPELTERLEAAADNLQQQQEQQLASSMERVRTEVLAQLAAQHHAHQQVVQCFLYGTLELLLLSVSELIYRLYFF